MNVTKKIGLIGLILITLSCTKGDLNLNANTLGSAEVVTNYPNDLNIAYNNFENVTSQKTYYYTCTTLDNELSIGGFVSSGSILITIKSEAGATLYSQTLPNILTANPILTAPAGTWTIYIKLTNASGSVVIDLDKHP